VEIWGFRGILEIGRFGDLREIWGMI